MDWVENFPPTITLETEVIVATLKTVKKDAPESLNCMLDIISGRTYEIKDLSRRKGQNRIIPSNTHRSTGAPQDPSLDS
jgi:hypothetical protein